MKNKNFQTQKDPFSKIYHEVLLLMKFFQTKPQIKNTNIHYFVLYYTVIKVRDENRDINKQYENDDKEFINCNDFITPNYYIGIKKNDEILR